MGDVYSGSDSSDSSDSSDGSDSSDRSSLEEDRLLAGRYRLADVLGRGGMGTVWRARDETLGRTVAVKELRFPSGVDEEEKRRLITRTLREAQAIARIRSGGAITVYDVVDEDDRPWIVMELIEGRSLAEVIREDGPLTQRRAAEVGLAVLDVLRAAHRQGILHRDVKPSNVLIAEEDGRVVLTDFGIAKVEGDPSVTSTGMLVGAPSYISPERARGRLPGPPSDLWSLGGLLYAAVEGHPPYDKGSAIATLTAVMTEPLVRPSKPGALTDAICGLLVKDPEKRLDDAGVRVLLERAAHAPQESPAPAAPARPPAKAPSDAAAAGAVGAAAGAAPKKRAGQKLGAAQAARATRTTRAAAGASAAAAGSSAAGAGTSGGGTSGGGTGEGTAAPKGDTARSGTGEGTAPKGGAAPGLGGAGAVPRAPLSEVLPIPRRILVAGAAVITVLAVLGTVLAFVLSGDGDTGGKGGDGTAAATSGTTSGASGSEQKTGRDGTAQDGTDRDSRGQDPAGTDPDTGNGTAEGRGADDGNGAAPGTSEGGTGTGKDPVGESALPAGYRYLTDGRFRFRMALPEGWRRTDIAGRNSGGIYTAPDGGYPKVQVDFGSDPQPSATKAWQDLEPAVSGSSRDYRRLALTEVTGWRDYPTVADWTFERTENGVRVRVLNRGFKVDGHRGYAIMITCKASEWDGEECRTLRDTAFATFAPTG